MKKNKLALVLAVIAGVICFSNVAYKLIRFNNFDYMILLAGYLLLVSEYQFTL
jgi:hypothetical protein